MISKEKLEHLRENGDIYREVDVFYVYAPTKNSGFLEASDLKSIAEYLDELNADWKAQVDRDLSPGFSNRVEITLTATARDLIDKESLEAEFGGDMMGWLRQIELEDGCLFGVLDSTMVAKSYRYLPEEAP
jgi:hypothetical protein